MSIDIDISRVNGLDLLLSYNLPRDKFVLMNSCWQSILGIRDNGDLDVLITPELLSDFEKIVEKPVSIMQYVHWYVKPFGEEPKDIINNQDAAPIGSPQFVKDPDFGIVCELDGKKDYLVHLPVDQLGMAHNYTASAWIKLHKGGHYDQPLFANSDGDYNATLVLLIRRMHPYLAHLHNDTVAGEKLVYEKWAHVVFRYHNGEQAIFVDGKLAVNSYKHSSLFSNRPLQIGC